MYKKRLLDAYKKRDFKEIKEVELAISKELFFSAISRCEGYFDLVNLKAITESNEIHFIPVLRTSKAEAIEVAEGKIHADKERELEVYKVKWDGRNTVIILNETGKKSICSVTWDANGLMNWHSWNEE